MNTNEYNAGYGQAPDYPNNAGYGQAPSYQSNAAYGQMPNNQNNMNYGQNPGDVYPGNAPAGGNNQKPPKTPNIFKQFAFSFVPPMYKELAGAKVGIMILLVLIVIAMACVFQYGSFLLSYAISGGVSGIMELFPDFTLENGEFSIAQEFYIEEDDIVIYMTEDVYEFDYDDVEYYLDYGFEQVMLVGRYNICMYTIDDGYQELYFSELGDFSLSKDGIVKWGGITIVGFVLVYYIFAFFFKAIWYFLMASIYLLLGMLLAMIFSKEISAGHIFKAAVFAKLPFFMLAALFKCVGLNFGILGIIRAVLTLVFFGFCVWCLPEKRQRTQYNRY